MQPQPEQPGSLTELLPWAAACFPDRAIGVYDRRGRTLERRTYPELDAAVRERARRLARLGVEPGERVVLCLDTSWELVESWFAVLSLGANPVTTAPPGTLGAG